MQLMPKSERPSTFDRTVLQDTGGPLRRETMPKALLEYVTNLQGQRRGGVNKVKLPSKRDKPEEEQ